MCGCCLHQDVWTRADVPQTALDKYWRCSLGIFSQNRGVAVGEDCVCIGALERECTDARSSLHSGSYQANILIDTVCLESATRRSNLVWASDGGSHLAGEAERRFAF